MSYFSILIEIYTLQKKSSNHFEIYNPLSNMGYNTIITQMGTTVDLNNPTRDLVGSYSLIGQVLTYKLLYAEALSYFSEALKVYELVPKSELIEQKPKSPPWLLINISNLYYATGDIENAKLKVLEAKENFLLYKNERNREIGLNTVYGNLGLFASIQGDYKLAEELYGLAEKRFHLLFM